jgi:hypothetical protein
MDATIRPAAPPRHREGRSRASLSGVNISKFERQVAARNAYARRTPGWMDSVALFRRTLHELVPAGARVLDLGCGRLGLHGGDTACVDGSTVVGVDTDHRALTENPVLPARIAGAGETYPVCYRANTAKTLLRLLLAAGFDDVDFTFNGDPSCIAFNGPLFALGAALERVMDIPRLQHGRVHLLGVARRSG